jgi:histone H3/H4
MAPSTKRATEQVKTEQKGKTGKAAANTTKSATGGKRAAGGKKARSAEATKTRTPRGAAGGVKKAVTKPEGKTPRPHRFRPGTVAKFEVRRYQKSSKPLMRKSPFQRLVRNITRTKVADSDQIRFQRPCMDALQATIEAFLVQAFQAAAVAATHSGRLTVMKKDIEIVRNFCMHTM